MNAPKPPVITVFGSYEPQPGQPLYELAFSIGEHLARAGYVVCNGGYGGAMEATAKGAKQAGGTTLGVTCTVFRDNRGKPFTPNPYIDREIRHDHLLTRIEAMMNLSSGFVVLDGGTGTLAEFAIVWEYVAKKLIEPRPIFLVGDYWTPVVERILTVRPKHGKHIVSVTTPEEIVAALQNGDERE